MHPSPSNLRGVAAPLRGVAAPLRGVAAPLLVAGATTALVFAAGLVAGRTLFASRPAPPASTSPASTSPPSATAASTSPPSATAASAALAVAPLAGSAPAGAPPSPAGDSCGLPAGITIDALEPADRSFALRRGFLCADRAAGRLSADEYRTRLALLDLAHPVVLDLPAPPDPVDDIAWASTVRAFSSQYTESEWSAARALGAPDVPAAGGDDPNAWASEGADDRIEFLEVGFDHPRRVRGVDIVENHNPGAVSRVELIATDGTRTVAYSARPTPGSTAPLHRRIDLACTAKPIAAVRLTLDSTAVPDWNEIDAIGLRPCTP